MKIKDLWNEKYESSYGVCSFCYQIHKGIMEINVDYSTYNICKRCLNNE